MLAVLKGVSVGQYYGRAGAFTVRVLGDDNEEKLCHTKTPANSNQLFVYGSKVYYRPRRRFGGAVRCSVVAVKPPNAPLVLVDTMLPNRIWKRASILLLGNTIEWIEEAWINGTRVDFIGYQSHGKLLLVEVKSTSLVKRGVAFFPASPNKRALRQVEALYVAAYNTGARAILVITVLRDDATLLKLNRSIDSILTTRLAGFTKTGAMDVLAYKIQAVYSDNSILVAYGGPLRVDF